jgi:hypothetical protein
MEHLAAYMTRLCHVENGVDNVFTVAIFLIDEVFGSS